MAPLKQNWLTDGLIDFEYKKYVLLAYLKEVKENFDLQKLYPFLSDLVFHYQNLQLLKNNKNILYENFPKSLTKADFEKLKLSYKLMIEDDKMMKELEEIVGYSLPLFQSALNEGKDIYEYVESKVEITPIGVTPIYADEGYMLVDQKDESLLMIYRYQITVFENYNDKYKGVNTVFIKQERKGIGRTFEQLKMDLIKHYKQLPNPATYLVMAHAFFPLNETLMPIAKRLLVRYINSTQQ